MYKLRSRGFTLIELLVVIAIIGILSAVVLASLNTARSKGQDAAIQSDLNTVQTQAEIYYGTAGTAGVGGGSNSYGANAGAEAGCATTDNVFSDANVKNAMVGADSTNGAGTIVCNVAANGTAYAAQAQLVVDNTKYWCVDSSGQSKQETAALGTNTKCP